MDTPDVEHGRVYFKQFGAERVNRGLHNASADIGKTEFIHNLL